MDADAALTPWAIALIVIAALLAASILAATAVSTWVWLLHGIPPRKQLEAARHKVAAWWEAAVLLRCRAVLRRGWGAGGKQAAVSRKYLLGDGLELAGAAQLRSKGQYRSSDGAVVEVSALHLVMGLWR
jgi:hypothetical protein